MTRLLLLALLLASSLAVSAQTVVTGTVAGDDGALLPYATVLIVGTTDGAATDSEGRFGFTTTATGRQLVEARFLGLEPDRQRVELAGDTVRVELVLRESIQDLGSAVVSADAFVSGADVKGLSPLDVVTTPGAAADLFQAIRSFPGLTEASEGAGLFVRGGDVSETAVLMDGAQILQPYQYESPQGGARGTISPWLAKGTRFSSGGFSARYGDALSGVLALDSQDEPTRAQQTLDVGLAGASVGVDAPLGRGGLRLVGNRSFTEALFWVNGRGDEFEQAPEALNGSALFSMPTSSTGRLKVLGLVNADQFGLRLSDPSFSGVFESDAYSGLGLANWTDVRSGWNLNATVSHSLRQTDQRFGSLRLRPGVDRSALRATAERSLSDRLLIHTGVDLDRRRASYRGEVPGGDVVDPDATTTVFDQTTRGTHAGAWAEIETQPARRVVAIVGLRGDAHSATGAALDPRASLLYALNDATQLRLAAGRYSQSPSLGTVALDDAQAPDGPGLGLQHATHLIAGVLHQGQGLTLRAEAYAKTYRQLVVQRSGDLFGTTGTGWARGLDLFARVGAIDTDRVSGWVSYSFLDARRTRVQRNGLASRLAEGRPSFGVAHSLNVVGKARPTPRLTTSARFRVAAGRPVTPVVGAIAAPEGDFFYPIDGVPGSETLPTYTRLDIGLSYSVPLGRTGSLVLYGAADNVLNRANAIGYDYSADYTTRQLEVSPFRRSVYVGATLLLVSR
ncbi:MAG: TonB-dependent receptor [Bacteroidota bacterium]